MEKDKHYFELLLGKYLSNNCTSAELEELIGWANKAPEDLKRTAEVYWNNLESKKKENTILFDRIMMKAKEIESMEMPDQEHVLIPVKQKNAHYMWLRVAAAVVIILTGFAFWFNYRSGDNNSFGHTVQNDSTTNDAYPGGNKATLTLADGSTIILDDTDDGMVTKQGNVTVVKLDGDKLSYDKGTASGEVVFNTITTPRGGQYQLQLSDGSQVWLNAESSLKYPVVFAGGERKVELTGEGYFEVSHDAKSPFYVVANNMEVQVLGTHFNVNAYVDEGVSRTTLLEGSVKISASGHSALLEPGQQAGIFKGNIVVERNVNVESAVAWKNGVFYFDKSNIYEVMRQLTRWYDVKVSFEGDFTGRTFSGQMKRDLKLSQVMQILEYNNIKYQIIGKQMIISL